MSEQINTHKLAFIGTCHWDLHVCIDDPKYLRAFPKPNACKSIKESNFGDKHHVLKLMRMGYFDYQPTDIGLEFLNGIHSQKLEHEDGRISKYLNA
jgi:hypothetical protein